jgi:hypothetical protein
MSDDVYRSADYIKLADLPEKTRIKIIVDRRIELIVRPDEYNKLYAYVHRDVVKAFE